MLGAEHWHGTHVEKDQYKSIKLYHQAAAAELGHAGAHHNLGIHYTEGVVVEKDTKRAHYHWKQAAILGNEFSRCNLGNLEERGAIMVEH